MIDAILAAVAVDTTPRFPCAVEVSIQAPGWEREITQALGIYSALSGAQFTAGEGGIKFVVKPSLKAQNGVDTLASWLGDTVSLTPAAGLSHNARLRITLHELGHAFWQEHNDEPDSVMYPQMDPRYTVHKLSPRDAARIAAAGCRDYTRSES